MSRRRHSNPCQTSLFHDIPAPARTRGQRIRIKNQWNETGRGDAEDAAELVRGVMIDRLDSKLEEFVEYCVDVYKLKGDQAVDLFQWVQVTLFPEAFDVDLDCEVRKQQVTAERAGGKPCPPRKVQGLLPRMGGDKITAKQIEAFHEQQKGQKGLR